jgi:hypothetical protein
MTMLTNFSPLPSQAIHPPQFVAWEAPARSPNVPLQLLRARSPVFGETISPTEEDQRVLPTPNVSNLADTAPAPDLQQNEDPGTLAEWMNSESNEEWDLWKWKYETGISR